MMKKVENAKVTGAAIEAAAKSEKEVKQAVRVAINGTTEKGMDIRLSRGFVFRFADSYAHTLDEFIKKLDDDLMVIFDTDFDFPNPEYIGFAEGYHYYATDLDIKAIESIRLTHRMCNLLKESEFSGMAFIGGKGRYMMCKYFDRVKHTEIGKVMKCEGMSFAEYEKKIEAELKQAS